MIRDRIPSIDDLQLYRLIVKLLVPMAQFSQPSIQVDKLSIVRRLNDSRVIVAARGLRKPFGFVNWKTNRDVMTIDMLAVDDTAQGRGWGRMLMDCAEREGRRSGCTTVQLLVDDINSSAHAFYVKRGYAAVSYVHQVRCYIMQKRLN